jgi:hypothetical protein
MLLRKCNYNSKYKNIGGTEITWAENDYIIVQLETS